MAANENVFNFDVSPFLAGVNKIGAGMDRIEGNAKKFGSTITGAVNKSVNGLILKVGGLIAAFKTAGAVLKEMPEVGQAFGLAKDIFLKNLLWPLRQQVMPLLQKMLDWVRDNRAQFVKWGATVANIFRTVVVVAKTLWEVFKSLVDMVGSAFQKAFNTNFKSFDEFLNVLSFKISAVIIFLGMLAKQLVTDFKPAFEWIIEMGASIIDFFLKLGKAWATANENGDSLWTVMDKLKTTMTILAEAVESAWKGFKDGFLSSSITQAMTPLTNIIDTFNRLLSVLGLSDTEGLRGAFSGLGFVLGTVLQGALTSVATILDGLVTTLDTLVALFEILQKISQGDWAGAGKQFAAIGEGWKGFGGRTVTNATSVIPGNKDKPKAPGILTGQNKDKPKAPTDSIHDGIVTKGGKVIKTDPQDNIFAAKKFPGERSDEKKNKALQFPSMNMPIGPFYVTVTEGDAEQAGRNFGNGLAYSFRNNVSSARLAEGR